MIVNSDIFIERVKKFNVHSDWEYIERILTGSIDNEGAERDLKEYLEIFDEADRPRTKSPGLYKWPGLVYFFELKDAQKPIEDDSLMDSFVYDRKSGIVVLNLDRGRHESFLGTLYAAYTGKEIRWERRDREAAATSYVSEGHGLCLSSVASRPSKGKRVRLSPPEKRIFERFTTWDEL